MSCSAEYGVADVDDDRVDEAVGRRVVAALELRQIEHDDVRVARRELRRPHLLHLVGRVVLRPHVVELERRLDDALRRAPPRRSGRATRGSLRDRAHRQDRIAEHLELLGDAVVEARVEWYGRPSISDRDAVLAPRPSRGSRGPCSLQVVVERLERLRALRRQAKSLSSSVMPRRGPQRLEHLPRAAASAR